MAAASTSSTPTTGSRSACSPAPAGRSAPAWTSRRSWPARPARRGARLRGHHPAAAAQAADRGHRGLRAGRRPRGRAGLRPDRGGERRPARHPGGQARAHCRRWGADPLAAADPDRDRDGAGADRRPDQRRAGPRSRPGQPAGRAGRRGRRGARAGGDDRRATARWRWTASKQIVRSARTGPRSRRWQEQAELTGRSSSPRTRARAPPRSRRSASRSGRAAERRQRARANPSERSSSARSQGFWH